MGRRERRRVPVVIDVDRLAGRDSARRIAAGATFGITNLAHADDDVSVQTAAFVDDNGGAKDGQAQHSPSDTNNRFSIRDTESDGYGVKGYLLNADQDVVESAYNADGNGGGSVSFSRYLPSGRIHYIQVCLKDGGSNGTTITCGSRVKIYR